MSPDRLSGRLPGKGRRLGRYVRAAAIAAVIGLVSFTVADEARADGLTFESFENPFASYTPLDHETLDGMRGGFLAGGLFQFFSISMDASMNGSQLYEASWDSTSGLTVNPTANPNATSSVTFNGQQLSSIIQSGGGNMVGNTAFQGGGGVFNVIQNTLDNVVIQQNTQIRLDIDRSMISESRSSLRESINTMAIQGARF